MKIIGNIGIVFFIIVTASCRVNKTFDSFNPIHKYELLGNPDKLGTGYMDNDSNIIFPMFVDTFQIHFDIDKKKGNALIFSTDKIDTVGNLSFKKQAVHFKPKDISKTYKLFDFKAKKNDSWSIDYCGILANSILTVEETKNNGNEIIQVIKVEDKSPIPPLRQTKIKRLIVSSEYGIKEMEIRVGWAEQNIIIKNAQ